MIYVRRLKAKTKALMVPFARRLAGPAQGLPIELWNMRVDAQGRLHYAERDVLELVREIGETPVHLLDVARLDHNLASFLAAGPEVYFSFKTQPLPFIIRRLLARGAGAEVISEYELRLALHLGAPPDKIIYNGPGKTDASIRIAVESGIQLFCINHLEEVRRVAEIARSVGRKVRVGIRANTSGGWQAQFGCNIASGEALAAYREALTHPELEVVGLHSHRGAHIYTLDELKPFVAEVLAFADTVRALGVKLEVIDFGGSLGIPTVKPLSSVDKRLTQTLLTPVGGPAYETRLTPRSYGEALMAQVRSHFSERSLPMPRVAIEPGRALTGNAQALLGRVLTTRDTNSGFSYAVLDAGVNIAGILGHEQHQIFRVTDFGKHATHASSSDESDTQLYRLVGPICQPGDVTFYCVRLPRLAPGDVLMIMDSGAYFEPDSTSFSFRRPATVAIEAGRSFVVRRAESFEDMIHRDLS